VGVSSRPIEKVLIANRGEIAVRVIRALRELGLKSVAVCSEADRDALHVRLADEAYPIGPPPARESYLRLDALVELACEVGADAIHPGYGFLSERAEFAERCRQRGVVFIGPSPEAIRAMGDKVQARRRMQEAGVPVVPGSAGPLGSLEAAQEEAKRIGYPVILKAAAGGGGKGMRVVREAGELPEAFRVAQAEALAAFGDGTLFCEKFLDRPRHIEIQVLGDSYGRVVALGERECSLQRRHQKVVEEAPSPVVDAELRRKMEQAAVLAAQAVGYASAGTCEFLLTPEGSFYFLEMNTRLQVEHPVTELVTGLDLVMAQLRIAMGEPLGPEFNAVEPRGHAIELRLCAEDPFRGFIPSPGRIHWLRLPLGPGVRVDSGVETGSEIPIHYDSMIAKLIAYGRDRQEAILRLRRALSEVCVVGVKTNVPLFESILANEEFLRGEFDIHWLDRKLSDGVLKPPDQHDLEEVICVAAAIAEFERANRTVLDLGIPSARRNWQQAARVGALRRGAWS
jgi:acetyl-CoA carboxylase biotin carboxylase subunit